MHVTRRRFLAGSFFLSTGAATGLLLAGCGSGGSNSGGGSSSAPTATTRAHVQGLHGQVARQMTNSGAPTTALAFTRNSYAGGTGVWSLSTLGPIAYPEGSGAGGATDSANAQPFLAAAPNLGGFLKNIAAVAPQTRAAQLHKTRDVVAPTEPTDLPLPGDQLPPYEPTDYFGYDYYLELWTQVTYSPTGVTYALYGDQAKTQPAGSIVTTQPADYNTYPQVYESTYSFTAGYLAGSHGTSKNTTNAGGSYASDYANVYQDGTSDSGKSNGSASGDFPWQTRPSGTNNEWTQGAGTYRSDGSGGTRFSTSDGYQADYTYNANGSGQGKISGSDPGMPVTITWDAYGNTTIRYADGTVENYNASIFVGDGIGDASGGNSGSGSPANNGTTVSPPAPTPIGI